MRNAAIICGAMVAALALYCGLLLGTMPAPMAAPPATDLTHNYGREYDGFPVAGTLAQHITNECARAQHVNPFGTITATQAAGVATCVEVMRSNRLTRN